MNFCLALTLLTVEVLDFNRHRKQLNSDNLIILKSNDWLNTLPMIGFMIYWFSDEPMNIWNIAAILGILVYGTFQSIRHFRLIYEVNENGILDYRTNKLKAMDEIQGVDFNSVKLAVHTSKFRNDLVILSKDVQSPTWEELTEKFSVLKKEG